MAMPPTAGTAKLENDMATWTSVVGHGGNLVCTVPRRATAYPTLDASDRARATASQGHCAPFSVSHVAAGVSTTARRAPAATSVPTPRAMLDGLTRYSCLS